MSFDTKAQAEKAGKEMMAAMKSTGWKLDVWENIGWHCALRQAPMCVHRSEYNKKVYYSCLMSERIGEDHAGSALWTNHKPEKLYTDPNKAVEDQVFVARQVLDSIVSADEKAESIATRKKK